MTASPATTLRESPRDEALTQYLEDIFMHAYSQDREVRSVYDRIHELLTQEAPSSETWAARRVELSDLTCKLEDAVADVCAAIVPAAARRVEELALVAPDYQQGIFDLAGENLDRYMRPIFAEAGIGERYVPHRERFPAKDDAR